MAVFRRYGLGARVYDVVSGERPVYRAGRVAGIRALGLRPGDVVLDAGCGTGLNLPLLVDAVGPHGLVIGVDRSPDMLRMARRRALGRGWRNVELVEADLATLDPADLVEAARRRGHERIDAMLATYALSVVDDWRAAWKRLTAAVRAGGRAGVVDMAVPTGPAVLLAPLALAACAFGGADIRAHPWRELERTGTDLAHTVHRGGHLHAVTGTLPVAGVLGGAGVQGEGLV